MTSQNESEIDAMDLDTMSAADLKTISPALYEKVVEAVEAERAESPPLQENLISGEMEEKRERELILESRKLERENSQLAAELAALRGAELTDEQLKEHFAKTKELQDQFTCAAAYVASVRHPAK